MRYGIPKLHFDEWRQYQGWVFNLGSPTLPLISQLEPVQNRLVPAGDCVDCEPPISECDTRDQ